MGEQCGIAKQEAQTIADRWLRSVEKRPAALEMRHFRRDGYQKSAAQTITRQTHAAM
jgi:hypothetical protein